MTDRHKNKKQRSGRPIDTIKSTLSSAKRGSHQHVFMLRFMLNYSENGEVGVFDLGVRENFKIGGELSLSENVSVSKLAAVYLGGTHRQLQN